MKGFFISFEGGEGAGKSVQVELLVKHLQESGYQVVMTREPGGTEIGEKIRAITHDPENKNLDAITEAYLMAASRAQHAREVILPALEAGKIVVCDRFLDSSLAYQGYGRNLGAETILKLNELAVNGAKPDMTIYLDIPLEVGLSRRNNAVKTKDRLDMQVIDFYERVLQGYLDLAKDNSKRYVVIDAIRPIEGVASSVWQEVQKRLPAAS